jgi:hypothetical protein
MATVAGNWMGDPIKCASVVIVPGGSNSTLGPVLIATPKGLAQYISSGNFGGFMVGVPSKGPV